MNATFERRKMAMPTKVPVGLSDAFTDDATKQTQWKAFLKKNHLNAIALTTVVEKLRTDFEEICGM